MVKITDLRSGLSKNQHHKNVEPFYTTKAIGIGSVLGLDIVKKAIT